MIKDVFFFSSFRVSENHDGTSSSWCQVFHTEMQRIDGHAPWMLGENHRWLPVLPWIHGFFVENLAPNFERKRLILEIHPFSFHGFHKRFPWIHGRSRVVVIPSGKVSRTFLTEVYRFTARLPWKLMGLSPMIRLPKLGGHLMDSGGEAGPNFQGPVYSFTNLGIHCREDCGNDCDYSWKYYSRNFQAVFHTLPGFVISRNVMGNL